MPEDFESVIKKIRNIPPMPIVAAKVLSLFNSQETNYKEICRVISNDAAISARLLKIANSPIYGLQRKISTLDRAISIVGERSLRNIVLAASLEGMTGSFGKREKMLWEETIFCALTCHTIAQHIEDVNADEAFLVGLFRHIGKIVMNFNDPKSFRTMMEIYENGKQSLDSLEEHYFSYTHAVIGAAVLEKWDLSKLLILTTLHHSDEHVCLGRSNKDPEIDSYLKIINLADLIEQEITQERILINSDQIRYMESNLGISEEKYELIKQDIIRNFEIQKSIFMN